MALLTCPECGRKVSEEASACPECGYPVDKMIGLQTPESQKKLGNGLGVAGFVVSIVALLFSFAASLGFILGVVAFGLAFSGLVLAIVKGNREKGLAIAGLVISIVAIACVFEQNINNASTPLNDTEKAELATTLDSIEPVQPEEDAQVVIGSTYVIPDLCEFAVSYAELKKEVRPPNPSSFHTYYPEKDGMTYLDVAVRVKNLRTTARHADEFGSATAIVGDGYEYDGFSTIEESDGGDFTYTSITSIDPLETAVLHFLFSIPNEVAENTAVPIILEMTMLEQEYTLSVR